MRYVSSVVIALALVGCANGYRDFYKDAGADTYQLDLLQAGQIPELVQSRVFDNDIPRYLAKNFEIIGVSSFNGKMHSDKDLIEQAKSVGATVVIYGSQFVTTQMYSSPLVLPNGLGGYNMTSISNQQMRYDQSAVFLAKSRKKIRLGLMTNELTPAQRKSLGSNMGVHVIVVYEESPAYYANIFVGDVVVSIDGVAIASFADFSRSVTSLPLGRTDITLGILRDGKPLNVAISLPAK